MNWQWVRGDGRGWAMGLAAWTLFAWINRIGNVLGDDELAGFARTWRLAVAIGFVLAAVSIVGLLIAAVASSEKRRATLGLVASRLAVVLAAVGSLWWLIRSIQILLGDWDPGFKIVHSLLAIVTLGLSLMVLRSVERRDRVRLQPDAATG